MAAFLHGMAIVLLLSNLPAWALLNSPVWEGVWNVLGAADDCSRGWILSGLVTARQKKQGLEGRLEGKLFLLYLWAVSVSMNIGRILWYWFKVGWEGMRMLRGCIIAAISYLLVIVTTIWHCSYTDVDKIFLKFTKQTNKKRIFLSPLESNYCCHFLIRNSWS